MSNGVETILRADVSENNVSMSLTYNLVSPISTSKADVQLCNPLPQTRVSGRKSIFLAETSAMG